MKNLCLILIVSLPLIAGSKARTYPASCDRTWIAVKYAAMLPYYHSVVLDDAHKKGVLYLGNARFSKRSLSVSLIGTGDSCMRSEICRYGAILSFGCA